MSVNTLWYPDGNQHYIGRVLDRLFISNIHTARALAKVNPFGIRFVVNATKHPVDLPEEFQVLKLDLGDDAEVPAEIVYATIDWIYDMIKYDPVLVHCWAGRSRSAALIAAYLVRCGMKWQEAVDFIKVNWSKTMIHPVVGASVRQALESLSSSST